jgi:hypothetical protein
MLQDNLVEAYAVTAREEPPAMQQRCKLEDSAPQLLQKRRRMLEADDACSVEGPLAMPQQLYHPQQQQQRRRQAAVLLPGGQQPNLPQAMQMLNALPESVKGCLLEAARLCGPGAGLAQEHLLSSFVAQARKGFFFLRAWVSSCKGTLS